MIMLLMLVYYTNVDFRMIIVFRYPMYSHAARIWSQGNDFIQAQCDKLGITYVNWHIITRKSGSLIQTSYPPPGLGYGPTYVRFRIAEEKKTTGQADAELQKQMIDSSFF